MAKKLWRGYPFRYTKKENGPNGVWLVPGRGSESAGGMFFLTTYKVQIELYAFRHLRHFGMKTEMFAKLLTGWQCN